MTHHLDRRETRNTVRHAYPLQQFRAIQYHLGRSLVTGANRFLRRLTSPRSVNHWCLTSLRDVEPTVNLILDDRGLDDSPEAAEAVAGDGTP